MTGEMFALSLDWFAPYVNPCADCGYLSPPFVPQPPPDAGLPPLLPLRVFRGRFYLDAIVPGPSESRGANLPTMHNSGNGVRCARIP